MTELQINQSIAEYCGWQILEPEVHPAITYHWAIELDGSKSILPDYCNDLNAMQEAKSALKGDKRIGFIDNLCEVVKRDKNLSEGPYSTMVEAFYSTAIQQAEALLKTIGKWKE